MYIYNHLSLSTISKLRPLFTTMDFAFTFNWANVTISPVASSKIKSLNFWSNSVAEQTYDLITPECETKLLAEKLFKPSEHYTKFKCNPEEDDRDDPEMDTNYKLNEVNKIDSQTQVSEYSQMDKLCSDTESMEYSHIHKYDSTNNFSSHLDKLLERSLKEALAIREEKSKILNKQFCKRVPLTPLTDDSQCQTLFASEQNFVDSTSNHLDHVEHIDDLEMDTAVDSQNKEQNIEQDVHKTRVWSYDFKKRKYFYEDVSEEEYELFMAELSKIFTKSREHKIFKFLNQKTDKNGYGIYPLLTVQDIRNKKKLEFHHFRRYKNKKLILEKIIKQPIDPYGIHKIVEMKRYYYFRRWLNNKKDIKNSVYVEYD